MKKLLVLALSVVMVLAFAAVSMAAVTVGGEVNFGFNMRTATPDNATTMSDFGDAKVTATAALNDEVTAFAALKGATNGTVGVDETWVKFTEGFGTFKVGKFGWNPKENLDILAPIGDLNSNAGMNLVINASEAVSIDVYANQTADKVSVSDGAVPPAYTTVDEGFLYGFKVKYAADAFGVSVGYATYSYSEDVDAVINLNVNYKLDAFNFYLTYAPEWTGTTGKLQDAIVGATYDSDSIYARVEYDVQPEDGADNAYGFRLGYKLGNGAKLEYNTSKDWTKDSDPTSSIKVNVAF